MPDPEGMERDGTPKERKGSRRRLRDDENRTAD